MSRWVVWRQPSDENEARHTPNENEIIQVFDTEEEAQRFSLVMRRLINYDIRDYWINWDELK